MESTAWVFIKSINYRLIAKLPIPRSTPFIGEWVNSIKFRIYMIDNGSKIGELVGKLTNSLFDDLQGVVEKLEEDENDKGRAKAQELKVLINEGRVISAKLGAK